MEISNQLINFIIEHANFDQKSNLLFSVSFHNHENHELIAETKKWHKTDNKLNFGGLIGIKILNSHEDANHTIVSFSSEYFKIDIMEFKNFVKKEKHVVEYRREG